MLFNEVVSAKSVSNRAQKGAFVAGKVACAATKVAAIEVAKAAAKVAHKAAKGEAACAKRCQKLDAEYAEMKGTKKAEKKEASQPKEVKEEKKADVKAEVKENVDCGQPKEIKEEKKEAATVEQFMNDNEVEADAKTFVKLMDKEAEESQKAPKAVKSESEEDKRFFARQALWRKYHAAKKQYEETLQNYQEAVAADDGSEEAGEYLFDLEAQVTEDLAALNEIGAKLGKAPVVLKEEAEVTDKRFRKVLTKVGYSKEEAAKHPRFSYCPEMDMEGYPKMFYLISTEGKGEQEILMDYVKAVMLQYSAFMSEFKAFSFDEYTCEHLKEAALYLSKALTDAEDAAEELVEKYDNPWGEKAAKLAQKGQQHMHDYAKELA